MYERILVPTDGSPGSEQVAAHAAQLAATTGGSLYGLYVVDETAVDVGGSEQLASDVARAFEGAGSEALDRIADVGADHGVAVTTELRDGAPHRAIVDYADEVGADVIVMGTHGRRGLARYILGSVTEHVLRAADQPVLAVKLDATAVTTDETARQAAEHALEAEGTSMAGLREDPYRERSTWVVPAITDGGERVNVHVDAISGATRVAHLDRE